MTIETIVTAGRTAWKEGMSRNGSSITRTAERRTHPVRQFAGTQGVSRRLKQLTTNADRNERKENRYRERKLRISS